MGLLKGSLFSGLSARYQQLAQGESGSAQDSWGKEPGVLEKAKDLVVRSSSRAKAFVAFVIGGVLFILLILVGGKWYTTTEPQVPILSVEPIAKYLHLLVTSPKPSLPSCRLLVSAGTNHYPTPNFVSWESSYNASADPPTSPDIVKVQGILEFFSLMGPERDLDLVMIPDSEATMLQLRPDILLERYWEIIRVGEERARTGMLQADRNQTFHKIIFAASKKCTLGPDEPACYAVPESPLPSNVYGGKTDELNEKEPVPHLYMRERYLSTSFVMGELRSVKALYERVLEALRANPAAATEQDVVARIFGDQEYYRAVLRQKTAPKPDERRRWWFSSPSSIGPLDPHPTRRKPEIKEGTKYDFGIALDYESLLSSDSVSPKTMGFVVHNDSGSMRAARSKAGVSKSGFIPLPEDIGRSLPPFWSRMPYYDNYPFTLGWKDVSLYTNLWSGSIPATIHYSSSSLAQPTEELPKLESETWANLWFHPYIRKKLNDYTTSPDRRFATLRGAGEEVSWWSIWREKWVLRRSKQWPEGTKDEDKKEWIEWAEACDPYWGDVLAENDGKKEGWKVPVHDW